MEFQRHFFCKAFCKGDFVFEKDLKFQRTFLGGLLDHPTNEVKNVSSTSTPQSDSAFLKGTKGVKMHVLGSVLLPPICYSDSFEL